jgi:hypothetical protein
VAVVEKLLIAPGAGGWVESDGKRCRIVGRSGGGGIQIDGGPGGFSLRTVTLTDLAWVLAAKSHVVAVGGLLDEARVNRLRYLDGTPRESTRFIDSGWAIILASPIG